MRRKSRVDSNQPVIVTALRRVGATVTPTHMVGAGFPDIVCGFRGVTYTMEIKDGALPPSARKLTPDEARWHSMWAGHKCIVKSPEEALEAIGIRCGKGKEKP